MKKQLAEVKRLQRLAGIIKEDVSVDVPGKFQDFNQWLVQAATFPSVKSDLERLRVNPATVTVEEFREIVMTLGQLYNETRGIYTFGKSTTVDNYSISFISGLEHLADYNTKAGEGTIISPDYDIRSTVYPQGSRMD